jgi:hypothetical protein
MTLSIRASKYLKYGSALLFFMGILLVGFFGDVLAEHTEQFKGEGFAYGSIDTDEDGDTETGIGYISFGCESDAGDACGATATDNFPTGYGVRINTNPDSDDEGKFFGYAWSSNYGWISFYHNDVSSCGSSGGLEIPGDVQNFIHTPGETAVLDGYARVLNYDGADWNGCIKFSGNTNNGTGSPYETEIENIGSGLQLSGWAWGSNLIGWVSFSCADCNVVFYPIDEECPEADDSEECAEEGPESGLALYVGGDQAPVEQIVGNSMYALSVEDVELPANVKLVPQTFGQDVTTCMASANGNQGASIAGWSGIQGELDPLSPDDISNTFIATISDHEIGEIITFNLECVGVEDGESVSAEAFVTIQYPEASISIDADPNIIDTGLDPTGSSELFWNFDNVQDNSCEIIGFVDFTPSIGDDAVTSMTPAFGEDIGFGSWSPSLPGSDDLFGIINFPVAFQITCQNFADQPVSDDTYITTTDLGCTDSMEAAGWCSNDINPIFEEF